MVKHILILVPEEIFLQTDILLRDMAIEHGWIPQNNPGMRKFGAFMSAEKTNEFFMALYGLMYERKIDGLIDIDEVAVPHR